MQISISCFNLLIMLSPLTIVINTFCMYFKCLRSIGQHVDLSLLKQLQKGKHFVKPVFCYAFHMKSA